MTEKKYNIYEIDVKTIGIVSNEGTYYDLQSMLIEWDIYYSIYNFGMTADIVVSDTVGLIERVPIVGDEQILFRFAIPGDDKEISLIFQLTSVTDRKHAEDRINAYVIRGVSQEIVKDLTNQVEKVYKDMPISDMVTSIYNEYLKPDEKTFTNVSKKAKQLNIDSTKDNFYYIATGTLPSKTIRKLSKEAQSIVTSEKASSFIFFENNKGWHFTTIDKLLKQEPIENFYFTRANLEIKGTDKFNNNQDSQNLETDNIVVKPYQKILTLDYVNQFDVIDSLMDGFYYNQVEIIDPIRKKYIVDNFVYSKDYQQINHIDKGKYISSNSPFNNENSKGMTNFFATDYGDYKSLDYIKNAIDIDPRIANTRMRHKFEKFNIPMFSQLYNIMIDITIPGNPNIEIGDIINVFIQQNSVIKEFADKFNVLFGDNKTAKFLVTALRHNYSKIDKTYTTTLQCIKDSYFEDPKGQIEE